MENRLNNEIQTLVSTAIKIADLENGYVLHFPAGDEEFYRITNFIQAERQCCSFLKFGFTVLPEFEGMTLSLTGPSASKEMIATLLKIPDS
ncbi:MAG: hypothetical protein AAF902_20585 [Chloroflexota bacterium]